ncbi:MAG: hypothetical protein CMJ83_04080 [Planctomycetes bacterium]|nr:hypothetical protein [Planctomycetota bacterium]
MALARPGRATQIDRVFATWLTLGMVLAALWAALRPHQMVAGGPSPALRAVLRRPRSQDLG